MAIHNLAGEEAAVSLSPSDATSAIDLFADRQYDPFDGDAFEFTIDPYGYRWLRLRDGE